MKTSFEGCGWKMVEVEFVQSECYASLCYALICVVNMAGRYRTSRHVTEWVEFQPIDAVEAWSPFWQVLSERLEVETAKSNSNRWSKIIV